MAEFKPTPAQQRAITAQGHNILVAASAGSGKTKVLVERVMRHLLAGTSITNLLIVTFTNAAALEMKERIKASLQKALTASPAGAEQQYLQEQLRQIDVADITTLDAFCLKLVRQYYYLLGLDPTFRLMTDDTEMQLLADNVYDTLREQYYGDNDADFIALTENFSDASIDESLKRFVFELANYTSALADAPAWLQQIDQNYRLNDQSSEPDEQLSVTAFWQKQFMPYLAAHLREIPDIYALIQAQSDQLEFKTEKAQEKYQAFLQKETAALQQLVALANTPSTTYTQFAQALTKIKFERIPTLGGEAKELIKKLRKDVKDKIKNVRAIFKLTAASQVALMQHGQRVLAKLAEVVTRYRQNLLAAKQRRNAYSFADVEHFALQLLTQKSGKAQAIRHRLQEQYHEIMVDEYQDTNKLQETILQQIAHEQPGNMFMVGDVKQSIYGFRLADPTLFLEKMNSYQPAENVADAPGELIELTDNFRSVKNITAVVNTIFQRLMDVEVGQLDYDETAALRFGAKYYPETLPPVAEVVTYVQEQEDKAAEQPQTTLDARTGQLWAALTRVKQIVKAQQPVAQSDGTLRPVTYGDIAILTRTNQVNVDLAQIARQLDIPLQFNRNDNYYQTTELRVMLAVLKIIDNPNQDIPMVAVLRSPLFGLDENELAALRINEKTGDYFTALTEYWKTVQAQANPYVKGLAKFTTSFQERLAHKVKRFMSLLNDWRDYARKHTVAELIWQIYQNTHYPEFVAGMANGMQRQANLHALYERAAEFEDNNFRGIYPFIRYIDQMRAQEKDIGAAPLAQDDAAVKVMTIHGSKGLEFPVVFLVETNRTINQAPTAHLQPSKKYGAAVDVQMRVKTAAQKGLVQLDDAYPDWMMRYQTLPLLPLRYRQLRQTAAEDMRLLYVALTRAQQALYIVGSIKNHAEFQKMTGEQRQLEGTKIPTDLRLKNQSLFSWIMKALLTTPQLTDELEAKGFEVNSAFVRPDLTPADLAVQFTAMTAKDFAELTTAKHQLFDWSKEVQATLRQTTTQIPAAMRDVVTFDYPHAWLTQTAAYQSVTDIRRLFDDPDEAAMQPATPPVFAPEFNQPKFMQTIPAKPNSAALGTATHLLLQVAQPAATPEVMVANLTAAKEQLVAAGVIEPEVSHLVDVNSIAQFYQTPLGQRVIANQATLKREAPFSLLLPAGQLAQHQGKTVPTQEAQTPILVHGIIDGYFIDDDGQMVLYDYKTDHTNNVKTLLRRYQGQLRLYRMALDHAAVQQHQPQRVKEMWLYLTKYQQLVRVD